jgi:hypothetical protein
VTGSLSAWGRVQSGVTDITTWQDGFAIDPRWGSTPRSFSGTFLIDIPNSGTGVTGTGITGTGITGTGVIDRGSFSGNIWIPGRDGSGTITRESWADLPIGRWYSASGSRLDALDSVVKARIPGWQDYGNGSNGNKWDAVMNSWSSMVADADKDRAWIFGGGHGDSSNNGLYRFDAKKLQWEIEKLPSDTTLWSQAYKNSNGGGTFSVNPESQLEYQTKLASGTLSPINDVYWDEIPGDHMPTSRHTYQSMVYMPDTNDIAMTARRFWRYDLDTGEWIYRRLINDTGSLWIDGEHGLTFYDEVTHEVLTSSAGSSGYYRALGYDTVANTWTSWSSPWNLYGSAVQSRNGRHITTLVPPENPSQ